MNVFLLSMNSYIKNKAEEIYSSTKLEQFSPAVKLVIKINYLSEKVTHFRKVLSKITVYKHKIEIKDNYKCKYKMII